MLRFQLFLSNVLKGMSRRCLGGCEASRVESSGHCMLSLSMPRRSLRPELNRIRGWVRQGRTDAWIAHQLEVTVQQIQAFKREQALEPDADPDTTVAISDFDDEIDLRAEDDALIAAELDTEAAAAVEEPELEQEDDDDKPKRRRGRRGGSRTTRTKREAGGPWEATFDHGEEGIGLWLDPAVQDDPVYAESWAGHRPVEITIEEDQIVIRRAGAEEAEEAPAEEPAAEGAAAEGAPAVEEPEEAPAEEPESESEEAASAEEPEED
jgi:hypothetical protein